MTELACIDGGSICERCQTQARLTHTVQLLTDVDPIEISVCALCAHFAVMLELPIVKIQLDS